MRTLHIARVILLSTIVFFLTGCQVLSPVGNFISQRYTNTASYFNTYYNARKAYSEAETEVLAGIQASREKSAKGQTIAYVVSSTARVKFTNSIEKNSKLLSYYPTSKFVDDALLMIGKSYYYLEEDVKAERKFLELISQYPESNLIPETKLWYGRSLLRQKRNTEGLQLLGTLYTEELANGDDDVAGRAALIIGEYYFGLNDYDNALRYYTQSVAALSDNEENARTQFQIGVCYSKLNDAVKAEAAFREVNAFSPDYNTAFQSAVYESRMQTLQKKYEPALEILFAKLDDAKYTEYFAAAHREVGNTYAAEGNITEALAQYRYVDTAFARTDDAARSMFALASLYEHTLFQFDSARTYYDKAKIEFSASEITPDAAVKSGIFTKYFMLKRDLANYDTLIMDVIHPRPKKLDSLAAVKADSVRRSETSTLKEKSLFRVDRAADLRGDTTTVRTDTTAVSAAATPLLRDSLARVDTAALLASAALKRQTIDSLSRQVIRTKFELAGLLYLEMNRPDSALVYYTDVVHHTTDTSLAARSYFTIAEIYAADSVSRTKTDSIYRKIIEIAPRSSYAQEARKNLGLPVMTEERDSAEVQYWNAERIIDGGKPAEAIRVLQTLAETYPKSAYAPKSLFTIGWIYENLLFANDSAESVYRQLTQKFPTSTYAVNVQPKLAEATAAQREAEQKAKADKEAKEKADAEAQKAKADKEAKDKAEAEKKNAGTPGTPIVPTAGDSAGARSGPDSAATKVKSGSMPAADSAMRKQTVPAPGPAAPPRSLSADSTAAPRTIPGRRSVRRTVPAADSTQKNKFQPAE